MISVAEAIQIVIDQTRVLTTELVAIQDSLGRVLART
jgi:molybdopterin biosynthesis enzyme